LERKDPRYVVLGSDLKLACSCFSWLQKNMGRSHSGLKSEAENPSGVVSSVFLFERMRSCHRIPLTQILEFERKKPIHPSFSFAFFAEQSYLAHSHENDTSLPG